MKSCTWIGRVPGAIRRFSPFACQETSLPAPVHLSAKLIVVYLLLEVHDQSFSRPFLPFWSGLEHPFISWIWAPLLNLSFFGGAVLLLFNLAPRAGCALAGAAVIFDILASCVRFSNSLLLMGCLLLLMPLLCHEDKTRWLIRGQIALLYGGAALNKLLHPDWQSGRFISFWAGEILQLPWYINLEARMGSLLPRSLCWITILMEALLTVLVLVPAKTRWLISLGLLFHAGMLIFTGGEISWIFLYVMSCAYLALIQWPEVEEDRRWWQRPLFFIVLAALFFRIT